MNELKIFQNSELGEIRTVFLNDEAFFMLKDVCDILEIGNSRQAKTRLNENGVITNDVIDRMGRTQQAEFINESNLYKLIFQSRKPQAEKFSEWVTSEVLPTIRKTGAYMTDDVLERTLQDPDFLIGLVTNLKAEKEKRLQAEETIKQNEPKVLFADSVATSKQTILIGDLAKLLKQNGINTGQNRLFDWLRCNGYLISRKGDSYNMPTQKAMELKLFEVKETVHTNPDGSIRVNKTTKVTGKGQQYFINKFLGK